MLLPTSLSPFPSFPFSNSHFHSYSPSSFLFPFLFIYLSFLWGSFRSFVQWLYFLLYMVFWFYHIYFYVPHNIFFCYLFRLLFIYFLLLFMYGISTIFSFILLSSAWLFSLFYCLLQQIFSGSFPTEVKSTLGWIMTGFLLYLWVHLYMLRYSCTEVDSITNVSCHVRSPL